MGQNISAAGTVVTVKGKKIVDFADDVNPVTITPVSVGSGAKSFSGAFLVWRSEATVQIEIAVTPDSKSDYELYSLWEGEDIEFTSSKEYKGFQIEIQHGDGGSSSYVGCVFSKVPQGIDLANSGRMTGRKYTFIGSDPMRNVPSREAGQQVAMIWNADTSFAANMA